MINERVLRKIGQTKLDAEAFIKLFRSIAEDAAAGDLPSATLAIPLYEENDLAIGEYAPELHLVVQRVIACE